MPRRLPAPYATVPIAHHALRQAQAEALRRRPGSKTDRLACEVIGHAWAVDREREGGLICVGCDAVRRP